MTDDQLAAITRMLVGWEHLLTSVDQIMPASYRAGVQDVVTTVRFALDHPTDSRTWPTSGGLTIVHRNGDG